MYDLKAIKAEIQSKLDQADALAALAKAEEREPTKEETAQFAALLDEVGTDANGDTPATGLRAKLATAERYTQILNQNRTGGDPSPSAPVPAVHGDRVARFDIPTSALNAARGRRLKAYGAQHYNEPQEGVENAYAAGRWLMGMMGHQPSKGWCEDHGIKAAMSVDDNMLGGYLVPSEVAAGIIVLREQYGTFRRYASQEPMGTDHKTVARRKAGLTAYAVGDGDAVTASDLEFNQVELTAKAWATLTLIGRDLDEDAAISLADRVADEAAYAYAKKEDQAGFIGDGTSTYHGVVGIVELANDGSHTGGLYTAVTGNTSFAEFDLADFEGMVGALPEYAEANAAWYIHKAGAWASMWNLSNAAGGNNVMDLGRGPELVFMGYPVRYVQIMNSTLTAETSTAGKVIFGDLSLGAILGNRRGFSVQVLTERYANQRQNGILTDTRSAVAVHSVTDPDDSTARGPIVVMKTPAS